MFAIVYWLETSPNPVHIHKERIPQTVCFRRWEWLRDNLVSACYNLSTFYLRICLSNEKQKRKKQGIKKKIKGQKKENWGRIEK